MEKVWTRTFIVIIALTTCIAAKDTQDKTIVRQNSGPSQVHYLFGVWMLHTLGQYDIHCSPVPNVALTSGSFITFMLLICTFHKHLSVDQPQICGPTLNLT